MSVATPNKSAPGKGGITVLFHGGRAWPALPERYRWAALNVCSLDQVKR